MTTHPRPQRGLDELRPYVPGKPIEDVKREYGLTDVIKMASNENPLGSSPKAVEAIMKAATGLNIYPDGASYDLRTALAQHFNVDFAQIAVGNGADDLILQLSMAYLADDDEVVTSRSSFAMYDVYAQAMRAKMIKTPLADGYCIDLNAMAEAISDRTRLVFVCNPNNPTGTMSTAAQIDAFLDRVPDHVLCVLDEAYNELVESTEYPDSLRYVREGRPNVIVLRTFSKVYGLAGIRLGYGFAHPDVVNTLNKIKPAFSVNLLAQAAGIAALEDTEFLQQTVDTNRAGRHQLIDGCHHLGLEVAESHTNFILVQVGSDAPAIQQRLLENGVIVRPCTGYDLPDFLRVSIGTEAENARFLTVLAKLLGK